MTATPEIHVKQYLYEDENPTVRVLIFYASNGKFSGEFEIYCHTYQLAEMGKALSSMLASFPSKYPDEYTFINGSDDPKDNYNRCFKMKIYTSTINTCAIDISMNVSLKDPYEGIAAFTLDSIPPAAIRKLGDLFISLSESEETEFHWTPN